MKVGDFYEVTQFFRVTRGLKLSSMQAGSILRLIKELPYNTWKAEDSKGFLVLTPRDLTMHCKRLYTAQAEDPLPECVCPGGHNFTAYGHEASCHYPRYQIPR